MIHSKLKQGRPQDLLVQFSTQPLPITLQYFLDICKQQKLLVKRSPNIHFNKIRFYLNNQQKKETAKYGDVQISSPIGQLNFFTSVIYVAEQDYVLPGDPTQKTIVIREGVDKIASIDYDIEHTLSQQQTLLYLCTLSASIISNSYESQTNAFDIKKDRLRKKQDQNLSQLQINWRNIIYQTPGVGKQKCKAIVQKFPTYKSILMDYQGERQLKNTGVQRGIKQGKLGKALAEKIYKIFTSLDSSQVLY